MDINQNVANEIAQELADIGPKMYFDARRIRLARATIKRYEAGKLKGSSALFHYQKACGLLLTHALTKD
jgi:hypothetical protein